MELSKILETILFFSQKPLSPKELQGILDSTAAQSEEETVRAFKKTKTDALEKELEQLRLQHESSGRGFRLVCVAGSWQFINCPEYAPWLRTLVGEKSRPPRLSQPGLETLAIIAYRQPVTRAEIEQIRGVSVDGVMQTLLERGLIETAGRAEVVGRPMMYATTPQFLEYFGLGKVADLPSADELRRIPVTHPEALETADPTAPPPSTEAVVTEGGELKPPQQDLPLAPEPAPSATETVGDPKPK